LAAEILNDLAESALGGPGSFLASSKLFNPNLENAREHSLGFIRFERSSFSSIRHTRGAIACNTKKDAGPDWKLWWVLGDPWLEDSAVQIGLFEKLVAVRVLACLILDAQANRVVWPPGKSMIHRYGVGLREVTREELSKAPRVILQLAERSRSHFEKYDTGLLCVDERKLPRFAEIAARIREEINLFGEG
jgi:hypothetical protein